MVAGRTVGNELADLRQRPIYSDRFDDLSIFSPGLQTRDQFGRQRGMIPGTIGTVIPIARHFSTKRK
jgi:hypothetical protein